jgi:hypothetical protein
MLKSRRNMKAADRSMFRPTSGRNGKTRHANNPIAIRQARQMHKTEKNEEREKREKKMNREKMSERKITRL